MQGPRVLLVAVSLLFCACQSPAPLTNKEVEDLYGKTMVDVSTARRVSVLHEIEILAAASPLPVFLEPEVATELAQHFGRPLLFEGPIPLPEAFVILRNATSYTFEAVCYRDRVILRVPRR